MLAVIYIGRRIVLQGGFAETIERIAASFSKNPLILTSVLLLMPVNWLLEALKWKILASQEKKVSLGLALQGVLAGVTAGTASPNRIGEFAGRIFIVPEGNKITLLILSAVSSFCQVLITLLAGCWALVFAPAALYENHFQLSPFEISLLYFFIPAGFAIGIYAIVKLQRSKKINLKISSDVFLKVLGLSALRYSVYVFQFALLISLVAANYNFNEAVSAICICYLLVTIIPTFSLTEMLVRGSVAGIVFSETGMMAGKPDAIYIAILLWLINVALPSLVGTIFVFRLKFFGQEEKS